MKINISMSGVSEVRRLFNALGDNLTDYDSIFKRIAKDFKKTMQGTFSNEGNYDGNPRWKALSATTMKIKMKKYPGKLILQATGKMKNDFINNPIINISGNTLYIGVSDKKAIYHQKGTRKMVARPIVRIKKATKDRWLKIINEEVFKGVK